MGCINHTLATHNLSQCWSPVVQRQDPRLVDHRIKRHPSWKSTYKPMALHGDVMPIVKMCKAGTKIFDIASISPLMATGETKIIKPFMY